MISSWLTLHNEGILFSTQHIDPKKIRREGRNKKTGIRKTLLILIDWLFNDYCLMLPLVMRQNLNKTLDHKLALNPERKSWMGHNIIMHVSFLSLSKSGTCIHPKFTL